VIVVRAVSRSCTDSNAVMVVGDAGRVAGMPRASVGYCCARPAACCVAGRFFAKARRQRRHGRNYYNLARPCLRKSAGWLVALTATVQLRTRWVSQSVVLAYGYQELSSSRDPSHPPYNQESSPTGVSPAVTRQLPSWLVYSSTVPLDCLSRFHQPFTATVHSKLRPTIINLKTHSYK